MRQSRERRNRGVRAKLTERDALVLEAVGRFRIARTRDLLAVAFADVHPMTASMRLRRLFDSGYLDVRAGDRAEQSIYALGPGGRRWATEQGLAVGRVPRGTAAHHLAIVRAWAGIAGAVQRSGGVALDVVRPDWELRAEFGGQSLRIVPDMFVLLHVTSNDGRDEHVALAVEVDLGTEPLGVLQRKLASYDELVNERGGLFGHQPFGLAVVLANPGRIGALRRLIVSTWHGWWLIWTEEEGPSTAVRELVSATTGALEAPVTDSCNGNRGSAAVSASVSTTSPRTRAGH